MTLGPAEAEEQLRYAVSVGADEAVLLATDGSDWDPQATAAALTARIKELEPFDLILFGNESADSGGYQVGIRVAHALGWPVISGIKGLEIGEGTVTARRETGSGSRSTAAAAGGGRGQGRDQPPPLSHPARTVAGQEGGGGDDTGRRGSGGTDHGSPLHAARAEVEDDHPR